MESIVKTPDWIIIIGYFIISFGIGIVLSKRGQKSTKEYFLSGRGVSWWILGTSMVATTFAADTPLVLSAMVVTKGIWGQWFWWCQVPITMLGVFFFARLWRRANILTDNELVYVRYSGKPASILRGFRGVYFSLVYQCFVMGWVNLAMLKIIGETIPLGNWGIIDDATKWVLLHTSYAGKEVSAYATELPLMINKFKILLLCFSITIFYTAISGLWGVLITDFFQFIWAMGGTILLAIIAIKSAGGLEKVISQMKEIYGATKGSEMMKIIPISSASQTALESPLKIPFTSLVISAKFLLYMTLLWWTTGYTDGGSYLAQRMLAAKDERNSLLAYLWYGICHYCVRPWPWLIVGMVAAVWYPYIPDAAGKFPDPELGYIKVMKDVLGTGLLGLLLAAFFAAYMSTIATQVNLGASYLLNDLYRPFIKKNATEKHYVRMSILFSFIMALGGIIVTLFLSSIEKAWYFFAAINAGIGIVYLARWYWWRVNAWSEITGLASCVGVIAVLKYGSINLLSPAITIPFTNITLIEGMTKTPWWQPIEFPFTLLYSVPISLIIWLTATFLTKPVDKERLIDFYKRVRPGGPGWKKIAAMVPEVKGGEQFNKKNVGLYILSVITLYSALLGIGKLILGSHITGLILIGITIVGSIIIANSLSTKKWKA